VGPLLKLLGRPEARLQGVSDARDPKRLGSPPDRSPRAAAVWALGAIGDIRAVDPLIDLLGEGSTSQAAEALGDIGDTRAPELLSSIDLPASKRAIGRIGGSGACDSLVGCLQNKKGKDLPGGRSETFNEKSVRLDLTAACIEALGELGDERAVQPVIDFLSSAEDKYDEVGLAAVKALARLGKAGSSG
jgi:HEAT repeat protein